MNINALTLNPKNPHKKNHFLVGCHFARSTLSRRAILMRFKYVVEGGHRTPHAKFGQNPLTPSWSKLRSKVKKIELAKVIKIDHRVEGFWVIFSYILVNS